FAELLSRQTIAVADPAKGKFRSFLLTTCKHYLGHERERAQAQKRGGGRRFYPHDFRRGEARFLNEPTHAATPEKLFERSWAITLPDGVFARLRNEYRDKE